MTLSKLWVRVAISTFVAIFPASGFADTYQILNLGVANSNSVYGIDVLGDVVIRGETGCGDLFYCYKTYEGGVESAVSATAPTIDYDNGSSCKPVTGSGKGACNDGYEAFGKGLQVFAGLDGQAAYLVAGSVDAVVINSVGDFAWTDGRDEYNFEAVDLSSSPVPEPNSLSLLLTGALGGVAMLRRRLTR